jgi:hypothetical protein
MYKAGILASFASFRHENAETPVIFSVFSMTQRQTGCVMLRHPCVRVEGMSKVCLLFTESRLPITPVSFRVVRVPPKCSRGIVDLSTLFEEST